LGSAAPEHELAYGPTGLDDVAAVEQVGGVVSELALSPFTKPEYDAVTAGTLPPYVMDAEDAVTTTRAATSCTVPFE
jgi:hypothetical protein